MSFVDLWRFLGFTLSSFTDKISTSMHYPLAQAFLFGIQLDGHFLLEAILLVIIIILMFQKSYKPEKRPLTEQEIDQLCEDWIPEALHPPISEDILNYKEPILESTGGSRTIINGRDAINLSAMNFLGLIGNERIKEASECALQKYGVGSCGPRGFYGTVDVHMDLENKLSEFMGVEDCILYSYALATPSSTIPAFCKRGDLIIADEGVHWGIQNGLQLSRSSIQYFKHNDMEDLERMLKEVKAEDEKQSKPLNRRFIVVEAIYQNSGCMAPMDVIMRLKQKYCFRVFVDESLSFGVLGKAGRGVSEHFNFSVRDLDIIVAGMGYSLASCGGFCCGDSKMVDHQRLSGSGYCFSASQPPFLASAAMSSIDELNENPQFRTKLNNNITLFREAVSRIQVFKVGGDPLSPVIFLHLRRSFGSFAEDSRILQNIVDKMLQENVLLSVTKRSPLDRCRLPSAIRVCISAAHVEHDLLYAVNSLKKLTLDLL